MNIFELLDNTVELYNYKEIYGRYSKHNACMFEGSQALSQAFQGLFNYAISNGGTFPTTLAALDGYFVIPDVPQRFFSTKCQCEWTFDFAYGTEDTYEIVYFYVYSPNYSPLIAVGTLDTSTPFNPFTSIDFRYLAPLICDPNTILPPPALGVPTGWAEITSWIGNEFVQDTPCFGGGYQDPPNSLNICSCQSDLGNAESGFMALLWQKSIDWAVANTDFNIFQLPSSADYAFGLLGITEENTPDCACNYEIQFSVNEDNDEITWYIYPRGQDKRAFRMTVEVFQTAPFIEISQYFYSRDGGVVWIPFSESNIQADCITSPTNGFTPIYQFGECCPEPEVNCKNPRYYQKPVRRGDNLRAFFKLPPFSLNGYAIGLCKSCNDAVQFVAIGTFTELEAEIGYFDITIPQDVPFECFQICLYHIINGELPRWCSELIDVDEHCNSMLVEIGNTHSVFGFPYGAAPNFTQQFRMGLEVRNPTYPTNTVVNKTSKGFTNIIYARIAKANLLQTDRLDLHHHELMSRALKHDYFALSDDGASYTQYTCEGDYQINWNTDNPFITLATGTTTITETPYYNVNQNC